MEDRLTQLKKFYKKNRRLPSFSEMLELFGVSSKNSIFKIIQKLTGEGFIQKSGNQYAPTSKFFALPMLGTVPAGFPIIADENRKYLTLDEYLIGDPISSFLFTVRGDSLIGVGIYDGDVVIVERANKPMPGDIVLAEIDREWTLKIFRFDEQRQMYLEAANPKYPPFYPETEMRIFGIVKAVVRKLRN